MSALINHKQSESGITNQNMLREENEMSAPATRGQSKLNLALQEIKSTLEELEMNFALNMKNIKTVVFESRRMKASASIIGGLALGAVLMTATALPLGTTYADGPNRPLIIEESLVDLVDSNLSADAWMVDSPFYQDFSEASKIEAGTSVLGTQGISEDAWVYDSPFYDIP